MERTNEISLYSRYIEEVYTTDCPSYCKKGKIKKMKTKKNPRRKPGDCGGRPKRDGTGNGTGNRGTREQPKNDKKKN